MTDPQLSAPTAVDADALVVLRVLRRAPVPYEGDGELTLVAAEQALGRLIGRARVAVALEDPATGAVPQELIDNGTKKPAAKATAGRPKITNSP